jgi:heme oxygenase
MEFALRLKNETIAKHKELDTHPFIEKMYNKSENVDSYNEKINLKYYLDLHFIILDEINEKVKEYINEGDKPCFIDEFNEGKDYKSMCTIKLTNLNSVRNLIANISRDNIYAYCYSFYLGILFGGQIIKKLINKTNDELLIKQANSLFDFKCNKKELIQDVKRFLVENIENQDLFIEQVNHIYTLTKYTFDDFDKRGNCS